MSSGYPFVLRLSKDAHKPSSCLRETGSTPSGGSTGLTTNGGALITLVVSGGAPDYGVGNANLD